MPDGTSRSVRPVSDAANEQGGSSAPAAGRARATPADAEAVRPRTAVVLAGGLGTRLRSVVADRPKPLAEIAGRPFLEYVLDQVRRAGITEVVLSTGHRAELVEAAFGNGSALGMSISYSVEREPLGTAGALRQLRPRLGGMPLLVMNGDSYFDVPLDELITFHGSRPATVSMALRAVEDAGRYGSVRLGEAGRVIEFVEKRAAGEPGVINGGIYIFGPDVLGLIPDLTPLSLEREVFPALIDRGIFGRTFEGFFVDIGLPSEYEALRANPHQLISARS